MKQNLLQTITTRVKNKFPELFKYINKIDSDDCTGLASEMAFQLTFTLFPVLLAFVSFLSLLQTPGAINLLIDMAGKVIPPEVFLPFDTIIEKLVTTRQRGIFTFSLIIAIVSSTAIFSTIIKAMERIWMPEKKWNFIRRIFTSYLLMFVVGLALILIFNLLFYGHTFELFIIKKYRLWKFIKYMEHFKFPLAFLIVVITVLLIYKIATPLKLKFSGHLPGALFYGLAWIALSVTFRHYIRYSSPDPTISRAYEILARTIIILAWMYANSLLFILGAELNHYLLRKKLQT